MLLLLVIAGCERREPYVSVEDAENEWIVDISVEPVEQMPSALRVQFSSTSPGAAWVEFGEDSTLGRSSPVGGEGTRHEAIVLGAAPLSAVKMRAVVVLDGEERASELFEVDSGQLPIAAPLLEVTVDDYDVPDATTLLMSVYADDRDDTVVMSSLGGEVFWAVTQADDGAFGIGVQAEEGGLAFNRFRDMTDGSVEGDIDRIDQWGTLIERIDVPDAHHYFARPGGGQTLWLTGDTRQVSGIGQVRGDQVMITDADGESRVLLDLFDVLEVTASDLPEDIYDWSHANWLTYDARRDTFLVCAGFINTIVEFNITGEVLDVYGGLGAANGDYSFDPPGAAFDIPHGVHWADNGDLLMFAADDETRVVQALRYEVDAEARVMRRVWSHGAEEGREPQVLGELKQLSDGNLLVNWGSWGTIQIVSPEGELLYEALTDFLEFPGQIQLLESPYF